MNPNDALAGLHCGMVADEGSLVTALSQLTPGFPGTTPVKTADILTSPVSAWRGECLNKVGQIPSAYTYLAQLMGHDMGCSIAVDSMPHVEQVTVPEDDDFSSVRPAGRYNLIRNPLTLETIYGAGPILLTHLYDPETLLFRLSPRAILASLHWAQPAADGSTYVPPVRALYDERNRDTLMLHELAVAWMQYHNLCALRLQQAAARPPMEAYALARAHVVRVWHGILRNDLLPRFVHPVIANLEEDKLSPLWVLDEPTLLAGLFRAFHSMPLASYQFSGSGPHNLDELTKSGFLPSSAERAWEVGWDQFFGALPGGPHSGISASVSAQLRAGTKLVAMLDLATAKEVRPLKPYQQRMNDMMDAVREIWPKRIDADQLARDLEAENPQASGLPRSETLDSGPLYQFLMVEAQCHGVRGGFGPLGSALLRASVAGSMARVKLVNDSPDLTRPETPKTMLELIHLVRRPTEWPS